MNTNFAPIPEASGAEALGREGSDFTVTLLEIARHSGPIFRLGERIVVWGYDLVEEVCDETRFDKVIDGGLAEIRENITHDALFTGWTHEPNWHKAYNILLPSFGPQAMRSYLPMMLDIAQQLVQKWARLNSDDTIDVSEDMTRLTLDTVGLCGFGYRFNSFYREGSHPFVAAMVRVLAEAQARVQPFPRPAEVVRQAQRQLEEDTALMAALVDRVIQERRALGSDSTAKDMLNYMLTGVDRQSGEGLDDARIRTNCIVMMIAGHETTSATLTFATNALLKHPAVLERAYAEVDRVLGSDLGVLPTYEQVQQLTYTMQILNETLRLWPPAPGFQRYALEDTVIGGKHQIPKGTRFTIIAPMLHRDRRAWGENADAFDPDRFSPENQSQIVPSALKPFGTGQRACIGRPFAMLEAALALGMILQRFELIDHLNYQLKIKSTLTIKPDAFSIKVKPRPNRTFTVAPMAPAATVTPRHAVQPASRTAPVAEGHNTPLLVLYGSDTGTSEGLARRIAEDGASRGFQVSLGPLDDYAGTLPTAGAVAIVTASYNGGPPGNARKFYQWLRAPELAPDAFAGVKYAVFGVGNRDWATTYQDVPRLIDAQLEAHGAKRLYPRGEADVRGDLDGQFRAWGASGWATVAAEFGLPAAVAAAAPTAPRFTVVFSNKQTANPHVRSYNALPMLIQANRELQKKEGPRPSERSTRHIEVTLPPGVSYGAGDHLGVLPRNIADVIQRVLVRFHLDTSSYITITPSANAQTHLPVNEVVPLIEVLANYVELQDVAKRADIAVMASHTADPEQREALLALAGDDDESAERYRTQVLLLRKSILDLLDEFPACALPFEAYLDRLPQLRPRYYSISSSPLAAPNTCCITVGVVEGPARSGRGVYRGIASNHLARTLPNSTIFGWIRKPSIPFQPPENPHTPMIMVGPGTGLAPFRGFLQERMALKQQGVPIGESLLFYGCRDSQKDFIYEDELRAFEAQGVMRMHVALSREPGQQKWYVQNLIREQRAEVWRLLQHGAVVFVCGDASKMAPDVRAAFAEIFREQTGTSEADGELWMAGLKAANRYLEDIWGG